MKIEDVFLIYFITDQSKSFKYRDVLFIIMSKFSKTCQYICWFSDIKVEDFAK